MVSHSVPTNIVWKQSIQKPINMIAHDKKSQLQEILRNYPKKFKRLGKLKNYQIQLHVDSDNKPKISP